MHLSIDDFYIPPIKNKGKHGVGGHRNEPFCFAVYADCDIPDELLKKWKQLKGIMNVTGPPSGPVRKVFFKVSVLTNITTIFGVQTLEEVPAALLAQLPTS